MKFVSIHFTKCVHSPYAESHKMLMNAIEDEPINEETPCSRTARLNLVEMPILPTFIYRFNVIPNQITAICPVVMDTCIL